MNRSRFFHNITIGVLGAAVLQKKAMAGLIAADYRPEFLYAGSYTGNPQEGISICSFDPENGSVQIMDVCKGIDNPSFLISCQSRKFIYAVNETANFGGKQSGSVSAFSRDEKSGRLTHLNTRSSQGAHPCHLTADRTGKFILVANYTGGNVAVLPILPDGRLGDAVDKVQHAGSGPNAQRQEAAHAHSVNLSPDNRFAFVCDLGTDKIMIYRFDDQAGKLTPADSPWFLTAPGAGPRHFTFAQSGNNGFVINELNSTITCFKYDSEKGVLTGLQTITTLPDGFASENTCADIHVHPNGRFVYASNRGHDSIAVFRLENESGKLVLLQHQHTLGKTPRNFTIHSSGRFLLAANQNSDSVNVFSIDPETGKLSVTGKSVQIPKPVCLLF